MAALEAGIQANEGIVAYGTMVQSMSKLQGTSSTSYLVETGPESFLIESDIVINAAGLSATRVAKMLIKDAPPECMSQSFAF
jgi:L-2-hydroxyglutarate oxidase LhgO